MCGADGVPNAIRVSLFGGETRVRCEECVEKYLAVSRYTMFSFADLVRDWMTGQNIAKISSLSTHFLFEVHEPHLFPIHEGMVPVEVCWYMREDAPTWGQAPMYKLTEPACTSWLSLRPILWVANMEGRIQWAI